MKQLARWAMSSKSRAILAIAAGFAVPLMFWLGAALLALVVMRQSFRDAAPAVMWGSLPAIVWLAIGDPTPALTAAGTLLAALVLRHTIRLDLALMVNVALGLIIYWALPLLLADVLPLVVSQSETVVSKALEDSPATLDSLLPFVGPMIYGVLAALHSMVLSLCLLLGRYWQGALYNPGGFGTEFRQLRLPLAYSLPAMLAVFGAGQLMPEWAGMVPVLTVAMMLAGLAVFHGLVKNTNASSNWLVPVYLALFVFGPYMYTLLIFVAAMDSLINIRSRLKDTASGE